MGDDTAGMAASDSSSQEEGGGAVGPWEDADSSDGETVRYLECTAL